MSKSSKVQRSIGVWSKSITVIAMVMMGSIFSATARPRAGPLPAATARRRRFVGDSGRRTLWHPQVPGNGTGLGRRATSGADVAHGLSEMRGGRVSPDTVHDAAPHRLQPVAGPLPASASNAARCPTDSRVRRGGVAATTRPAAASAAIAEHTAAGCIQPIRTIVSPAVSSAALSPPHAGDAAARYTVDTTAAAEPVRLGLLLRPLSTATVNGLAIRSIRVVALAPNGSRRDHDTSAAVWAPRRDALTVAAVILEVSSALAASGSGALG